MGFIAWIILGLIVGAIVKAVMPGRVGGGWVTSLILGVVGAIVGGWIGELLFGKTGMMDILDQLWYLGLRHHRWPRGGRHLRRHHRPESKPRLTGSDNGKRPAPAGAGPFRCPAPSTAPHCLAVQPCPRRWARALAYRHTVAAVPRFRLSADP